ncbi:MAG: 2-dehydropantoate 2-reductase [Rhodospirillales bacterium]|nr:2-dehydropantoate 2-reductase [Rhodospirillales bacterium]
MKILVLGAGAVGGYFGGRLVEAGGDVTFLVRPHRAISLEANGLIVRSPFGDIRRPVPVLRREQIGHHFDIIVLSCKAYDLDTAMDAIEPAVGPDSRILPLLNGLSHMDRLDERFDSRRVLGGLCHLASTMTEHDEIHHLNRLHRLTLGDRTGRESRSASALAGLLEQSTVEVILSANIAQDMWEKFVFLTALAATTCLMRASIGDIMAAPSGEAIVVSFLEECIAVAEASGHRPRPEAIRHARELLTEKGSSFTASMLRDMESNGLIEADHTVGDMLARADNLGVSTPYLRIAFCHLKAYENRRNGSI